MKTKHRRTHGSKKQTITDEELREKALEYLAWCIYADDALFPKPWSLLSDGHKKSYTLRALDNIREWHDDSGMIEAGMSPLQIALRRLIKPGSAKQSSAPIIDISK